MTPSPNPRTLLQDAETRLEQARDRLGSTPPDYVPALDEVLVGIRASLLAFLAGYGATLDLEASLDALADQAVRCSSVLKTPAHRAVLLARRAPAIRLASTLSVHDREDVDTGWWTARNLYDVVVGQLSPVL